jgi:hypothetical protein
VNDALLAAQPAPRMPRAAGRRTACWLSLVCLAALLRYGPAAAAPAAAAEPAARDGQHDFDFELGSWNIHLRRRLHPLSGSNEWIRFDGTSVTRKVWDGRAQLEEFETDGAGGHIEGLTLRLYNPQTHQWSLYWANSKDGTVVAPQVGEFKEGVGEFYGWDTLNGRPILIRFIWSKTSSSSPHFEQSFSADGGKTWEVNWITDQTRLADTPISERVPGSVFRDCPDCPEMVVVPANSFVMAPLDGRPAGTENTCLRVDRGGSWSYPAWLLRSATRERNPADYRDRIMGFRLARTLP